MSIKKLKRFDHLDEFGSNLFTCINYKKFINKDKDFIQIASFDPGVINTGCRIESREKLSCGKVIIKTVKQLLFKSGDLKNENHYFLTMNDHLFSINEELYNCDYILVESQMVNNTEAMRMSQHIISTLLCIIKGSNTFIIEILPIVKSRSFGVNCGKNYKKIKGKDLKKWSIEKSFEILNEREDFQCIDLIKTCKKKDDHADVILYCDLWYRYLENKTFDP